MPSKLVQDLHFAAIILLFNLDNFGSVPGAELGSTQVSSRRLLEIGARCTFFDRYLCAPKLLFSISLILGMCVGVGGWGELSGLWLLRF